MGQQLAGRIAELHKYGNHMFDWSNVYRVGIFSRFLKVALGKGHKHSVPVGGTKIAYGLPSFKP